MWNKKTEAIGLELARAICRGDIDFVKKTCADHPWLITDYDWDGKSIWIKDAAIKGNVEMMATLLDLGFNIDAVNLPDKSSALDTAISFDHPHFVKFLLSRGANPNLGRCLIGALNRKTEALRWEMVKLLVEGGINVNLMLDLYGNKNAAFTALDHAVVVGDHEIADYLRQHGAKHSHELFAAGYSVDHQPPAPSIDQPKSKPKTTGTESKPKPTSKVVSPSRATEIIDYFTQEVGPVSPRPLMETIPSPSPIQIHIVPPKGKRKHVTVFTTGLSDRPMKVPKGENEYAYAELFLELRGDWPHEKIEAEKYAWPFVWLRRVAEYPIKKKTWLGGPATLIANDDPPKPLAPGVKFTTWLLLAEKSVTCRDGKVVQLYRMAPLHTKERQLEIKKGLPELMRTLDRHSVPFIIDPNRPSVVK